MGSNPASRTPLLHPRVRHSPPRVIARAASPRAPNTPPLRVDTATLRRTSVAELQRLAEDLQVTDVSGLRKQDLIVRIEHALLSRGESITAEGTLELVPEGHGFLRSPDWSYLAGPDDVYVSLTQVRRFGIKTGDTIRGAAGQCLKRVDLTRRLRLLGVRAGALARLDELAERAAEAAAVPANASLPLFDVEALPSA